MNYEIITPRSVPQNRKSRKYPHIRIVFSGIIHFNSALVNQMNLKPAERISFIFDRDEKKFYIGLCKNMEGFMTTQPDPDYNSLAIYSSGLAQKIKTTMNLDVQRKSAIYEVLSDPVKIQDGNFFQINFES